MLLLRDLKVPFRRPVPVLEDNQGTIAWVADPSSRARSKHLDVRHKFIIELADRDKIVMQYTPSSEQVADILTKPLVRARHAKLAAALGLRLPDAAASRC